MTKALAPFLFLALSAGLFFTYIRPAWDVLGAFQDQEARVNIAVTDSSELKNRTTELVTKYAEFEANGTSLNKLLTSLPDSVDAVRLVINIDALAQAHDVTIVSFELPQPERAPAAQNVAQSPDAAVVADPIGEATVRLVAKGSYADLKAFLQRIERSLTILDITQLTLAPSLEGVVADAKTAKNDLQASVTLKTYWLR